MNKKILKVVIIAFITISSFMGITLYFISTKINPDKIKEISINLIEEQLPGSTVTIEKIDYSLSTSVTFKIDNFSIKHQKKVLSFVKSLDVKVPIWSILTGGGKSYVSIDHPLIHVGDNYWVNVLPKTTPSKSNKKERSKEDGLNSKKASVQLPSFIANSKVDFKIKYLNIVQHIDQIENKIDIEKVLLKNFSLNKKSAFEIISNIDHERISTNASLLGTINLSEFLKNKNINTDIKIKFTNTFLKSEKIKIPNVEFNSRINMSKELSASVDFVVLEWLNGKFKLDTDFKKLRLSNLYLEASIDRILRDFDEKLLKEYSIKSKPLKVEGSINMASFEHMPNLSLVIDSPTINLNLDHIGNLNLSQKITVSPKAIESSATIKLLKGEITSKTFINYSLKDLSSISKIIKNVKTDVFMSNIQLTRRLVRDLIYKSTPTNKVSEQNVKPTQGKRAAKVLSPNILLPRFELNILGKLIKLGKNNTSVLSKVSGGGASVKINKISFSDEKGKASISCNANLESNKVDSVKLSLKNVNLDTFGIFLPPMLEGFEGIVNGKSTGFLVRKEELKFSLKSQYNIKNGRIKNLNLEQIIESFVKSLKGKVPSKAQRYTDKFDTLSVDVSSNEVNNKFRKIQFVGYKKSLDLNLKGNVSTLPTVDSNLVGTVSLQEFSKELEKKIGDSKVDIKLSGKGLGLKPDSNYILTKAADKAAKHIVKKNKKKIEKNIKKEIEKKARDLFKGFKL